MRKWIFPVISATAAVIVSLATYARLPERMAIHFNAAEEADRWVDKSIGAFLLPVIILLLSWLTWISLKLEKDESKRRRGEAVIGSINAVIAVALFMGHLFTIAYNLGYEVSVAKFASFTIGFIFLLIGNLVPRIPQGSMKWPNLSDDAMRKFSRFHGRFMVAIGIGFLLMSLLPVHIIFPAFIALMALFIIVTIGGMIRYSRLR